MIKNKSLSILYVFALQAFAQLRNSDSSSSSLALVLIGVTRGAGLMKHSGVVLGMLVFFSSRSRHTKLQGGWSSDVCSSDLIRSQPPGPRPRVGPETSGTPGAGNE